MAIYYLISTHISAAMEGYKPYADYITNGGVAETAYILSKEGAICATNLPIKELPRYNFEYEDEKNQKHQVVVDERILLLEALANHGVPKNPVGIRLYNQKYYLVRPSEEGSVRHYYLKKVPYSLTLGQRRSMHLRDQ